MKKLIIITMLVALSGMLRAQTIPAADELRSLDGAIGGLATQVAKQINRNVPSTFSIGQFSYMGTNTHFNAYLRNQLAGELTSINPRSFTLLSGGASDVVLSGEIVRIGDLVRIYARLLNRQRQNEILFQTQMDLEANQSLLSMLSSIESGMGGGAYVIPDQWEADNMDAPVEYDGTSAVASATTLNRTIQGGDEDWFLVSSAGGSQLVMETTGSMDTYMTVYDADTREEIASNDDDNGSNARVRIFVGTGRNYIVKVRGYSTDTTGEYGFRAYSEEVAEPTPYELTDDINDARFVMRRLEQNNNMFLLTPREDGLLVMETSGSTDVYMELYDAETFEQLASDDDSGYDNNARITYMTERGSRYIVRVRGYSSGASTGQYGFKAYLETDPNDDRHVML